LEPILSRSSQWKHIDRWILHQPRTW